ncbi:TetR/AcrR family transcriptional regulator [Acanthopleuribacter pedis]|uniref:TetR/AcrR family transcriptional regulator n=1 Tax=Acanthopleuribacter pedis TaxID=442870 RepID=A0A8J7Q1Q3_9BACT|nr:TetR/AcrR family transcriptional regulator [Acanthopleuribacter pedis]MBO1317640.1 TetR/AcrR family transcriptional regulator [Acanthopleuribacter pedis]
MARAPKQDPAFFRQLILKKAAEMLREQGIHGLSMRKLAQSLNASTMVLYTYFKNKQGLLNALYLDGFDQLRQELERVEPDPDPIATIMDLGRAYRRAVLANADVYELMMSRSLHGFSIPEESLKQSGAGFRVLEQAVVRCQDAGFARRHDAKDVAQMLWGTIHGLISLQLAGHFIDEAAATARFELTLATIKDGIIKE